MISLSKYEPLWRFLSGDGSGCIQFSFERIDEILGFPLDYSFLNYKQEAEQYGYNSERSALKLKRNEPGSIPDSFKSNLIFNFCLNFWGHFRHDSLYFLFVFISVKDPVGIIAVFQPDQLGK